MHICMFARLGATISSVHVVETRRRQASCSTPPLDVCVCSVRRAVPTHPPGRASVLSVGTGGVVRSYSWVLLEACFGLATRGATGR